MILNPQHLKIFGNNISIGDYATLITAPDKRIDLSTWETDKINGELQLGKYILISPGTSIRSAQKIVIGDSTMIASDVTITDSDWHDIYDRTDYVASPKEVIIQENVWIGEKSLILKGSKIGKNSIIGAGSVVSGEVPANVIFAGNPAKQIKKLDEKSFKTRESLFSESSTYLEDLLTIEKKTLEHNSLINWLKSLIWPGK
ncbi:MAG: acyltransferase [Pseudomonadota bacterium]|jgi:acetyltransferase-like isoleucine patch superfamily enzyme|nr:acyltransferase [Pseudomonadota bacterium]|tara:strand:+ start:6118 stop:6720 length:603 start_codon:yes stop_codon:yes gene_type:complete